MQIKNYRIGAEIGRGGMAVVYQAFDEKFDTLVAIKFLNKEFAHNENIRKRFLAEAKSMFRMSHPNIIKVTDLIDEGDVVAFVMEFAEGVTLKEHLDRKGRLKDEEIISIFTQMQDAVGYVHDQRLVHRDIKPSNFMIDNRGKIKLMDFGIAKALDPSSSEYTQTGTGMQMGTPMYMSPEQVRNTKTVGAPSDIYSLGVVLWQMVSGRKPYNTELLSTVEIQIAILQEPLPLTRTCWDSLIARAMEKDSARRISNCSIFLNELNRLRPGSGQNAHSAENTVSESYAFETHRGQQSHIPDDRRSSRTSGQVASRTSNTSGKSLPGFKLRRLIVISGILLALIAVVYFLQKPKEQPVSTAIDPVLYEPEMIRVEGGTFTMGDECADSTNNEACPAHTVTLNTFSISKFEITQSQWKAVMGKNPSSKNCDNCPVEQVTWNDVQDFINELNSKTGKNYRLPTEAEWEYAAKGGNKSRIYKYAGSNNIDYVAWHKKNSSDMTHSVGLKQANELGIYDMSGNVWEWCSDRYGSYGAEHQTNPQGWGNDENRVLRGGSYYNYKQYCQNTRRFKSEATSRFYRIGFRLAM